MEKDTETIRTSLRIPKPLYDQLHKASQERGLTMHADMIARLEASFAPPAMSVDDFDAIAERVVKGILASGDPRFASSLKMGKQVRDDSTEEYLPKPGTRAIDLDDK